MKLRLQTNYDILDEVAYKYMDTWAVIEGREQKDEIKESKITTIDIQIGLYGEMFVRYGMENEDEVSSDCIIGVV